MSQDLVYDVLVRDTCNDSDRSAAAAANLNVDIKYKRDKRYLCY